ncbi:MAG TPA: helix-turn-helix transcriptional regulator [Ramlibacter sp.]|nr:helix-turn-helix transcriptional regulator [Ramlibacter sp.]
MPEIPASADAAFAPTVAALGTLAFASELLAALNRGVPVDHVCLMRFADRSRPPVLESASWRGGDHVGEVQRAYLAGLYRQDPNLKLSAQTGVAVHHLPRDAIASDSYRASCYQRAGLLERLTVSASDAGQLIALNLYRLEATGPFIREQIRAIEALAPLLAALAVKHVAVMNMRLRSRDRDDRIDALGARLHATNGALTPRERTVLARVLTGMTSQGIALDLGLALSTVLTYRKRAYARLGVSSQAELFALMI